MQLFFPNSHSLCLNFFLSFFSFMGVSIVSSEILCLNVTLFHKNASMCSKLYKIKFKGFKLQTGTIWPHKIVNTNNAIIYLVLYLKN